MAEHLEDCAQEIVETIAEKRRERNPDFDTDEEDDNNRNR